MREINFALSQSAKKVHSYPTKYRIQPSLRAELEYISRILPDTEISLHTPIAIMGSWSTDLKYARATLAN